MTSPFRFSRALAAAALLTAFAASSFAQQAQQGQTSVVSGQSAASIASGAVVVQSYGSEQLPWTSVDQNFHTNQAASAPANIGSVASGSNTGCPAVDGWSASIVVANGGKTTAQELPGCMLNILGQNMGQLKEVEVGVLDAAGRPVLGADGQPMKARRFDGLSVMRLEAWCLFPLYKKAIENGMNFKCKETRDAEAQQAQQQQTAVVNTVVTDPIIAASGRRYPSGFASK